MRKCKNLLIGFFYKDAKKYFKYYFDSINKQDTNNFELLIIADNIKLNIPKLKINYNLISVKEKKSISSIRNLALTHVKKNKYKIIIFSDTDDYFSPNRVSQSIYYLSKYDFVFNNIYKIDRKNKIIKKNLYFENKKNFMIDNINLILKYNYIGFTNSAIRVSTLNKIKFPQKIIALDWYLFSLILINKKKGLYLENVISFYREHSKNYSKNKISIEEIKNIINIKVLHYRNILNQLKNLENSIIYKKYFSELNDLIKMLNDLSDKSYKTKFIKSFTNKTLMQKKGWWSEV